MMERQFQELSASRETISTAVSEDTLHMLISHQRLTENGYQFTLRQPGAAWIGGPALLNTLISAEDIHAIRVEYKQRTRIFHDLMFDGIPVTPPDEGAIAELGQRIAGLLPPLAQQSIVGAVRRALRRRRLLRIILEVTTDARELLSVPWELMHLPIERGTSEDDGGETFPLLHANITLIRQVQGIGRHTTPSLPRVFTFQALAATPEGAPEIELEPTHAALAQVASDTDPDTWWYQGCDTLGVMLDRLRAARPQLLHLLCHGEQSDTGRGIRSDLLFTHRDGYPQRASAADIAPLLTLAPDLQVVILQACWVGRANEAPAATVLPGERLSFENIALALVRHGVPMVIAMQGEVGQNAASAFVQAVYDALKQGWAMGEAIAAGRVAMRSAGAMVDWSLPVIYQGSGQPEPSTWYTRIADRIDAATRDPATLRTLRGILIAWALALLTIAVVRWLLSPPAPPFNIEALAWPLAAWLAVGIVGPAIIATAHQGTRYHTDIDRRTRGAVRRAQWMGAYLGYALAGILEWATLASLWVAGVDTLIPPSWSPPGFGLVIVGALGFSYVIVRSQARSALAITPLSPELFDLRMTAVMLVGMGVLLVVPPLLILGVHSLMLGQASIALSLAVILISAVLLPGS